MGQKFANFSRAKLASPPSGTGGLSFSVQAGKGALFPTFGAGDYAYGVFTNATKSVFEVVKIEARSTDAFTIATASRGLDGTTAQTWTANDYFYCSLLNIGLAEVYNAAVTAIGALTPAANKMPYYTGASAAALTDLTAAARTVLDDADVATMRATLGATNFGNKNAVMNGEFLVSQRGTSFAAAANGTVALDRWIYAKSGGMVHTISQDTSDAPSFAESGRRFNGCMRLNLTTADTSIGATDLCTIYQPIEGYVWQQFAYKTLTLSFWVKATTVGTYCVALVNAGSDRSFVAEYTINVTNTWEYKTVSIVASPSTGGTWDYTTGRGVALNFVLAAGTNAHTTAGAWQTGSFSATSNQVNGVNTGSTDFKLAAVQLERGSVATEFEGLPFHQVLLDCMRYYEVLCSGTSGATNHSIGYVTGSGDNAIVPIRFMVKKRATPTAALSSNSHFQILSSGGTYTVVSSFFHTANTDGMMYSWTWTPGSASGGQAALLLGNSASALFAAVAELT